jgi:tungstate transport system substrate-binding protein
MANDERDGIEGKRRSFLHLTAGTALLGAISALSSGCARRTVKPEETSAPDAIAATTPAAPVNAKLVRVLSVPTAVEGALLPGLVADFQKQSGLTVELSATDDVYGQARAGKADLAISHYGHRHAEQFVMDGFGEWPRTLFSNQMALLGPKGDPAKVRGLEDAAEAFKRIATAKSPFVLNDIDGIRYREVRYPGTTRCTWIPGGRHNGTAILPKS